MINKYFEIQWNTRVLKFYSVIVATIYKILIIYTTYWLKNSNNFNILKTLPVFKSAACYNYIW